MSNPTRQEIISAYDAILELQSLAEDSLQSDIATIRTLGDNIVTVLPRIPKLTIAEVEWDDDEHYLAEAEHPEYGKVIMLSGSRLSGIIKILVRGAYVNGVRTVYDVVLTPTGKRYTLTEVQE